MDINLDSFTKKKEEMEAELQKQGAAIFKKALKEVFEQHPNLVAIRWRQYTPYFNDGSECIFGIHGVYFKLADGKEEDGDYEDGFVSEYDESMTKPLKKTLNELEKAFGSLEDQLKAMFGDHKMVTATKDDIEVEDCDHD